MSTTNSNIETFPNITKSPSDRRQYLGLKLPNNLKVLLVSDPETDLSAVSLTVHVGSMCDPWDRQGLAHLLEHLLFMGSEKVTRFFWVVPKLIQNSSPPPVSNRKRLHQISLSTRRIIKCFNDLFSNQLFL